MKGLKKKDKERYINPVRTRKANELHREFNLMKFTYLDLVPIVFDRHNVMEWLANTGWIEGMIIKYLGDQCPYLDDYIQEIYLLIFDRVDKLIEIYENRGILAFCGYIKMIVFTSSFAKSTATYKNIRSYYDLAVSCSDEMWNDIIDTYDPETMQIYKFNKTNNLI